MASRLAFLSLALATAAANNCHAHMKYIDTVTHLRGRRAEPDFSYGNPHDAGRKFFQENWEPDIRCIDDRRLGVHGDGGKWVCNPACELKPGCVVFSVGSNNDFSFEEAMHPYGCSIYTFDHTVASPNPPPYVTFYKYGIGLADGGVFRTVQGAADEAGVTKIDVLKIDCEGCELDVFSDKHLLEWMKANVRQLLVEVHYNTREPVVRIAQGLFDAGFRTFSKEPNIQWSDGSCVEFSMLNINFQELGSN